MRFSSGYLLVLLLALTGCATTPPTTVENACRIFAEKGDWYKASLAAEKKYGLPVQIQLAIMRQESSFKHNAAPPRATFLGVPMWWRQSSAYGYAQAKDSTWEWYQQKTGNWSADRDNYADAVDFMGWYASVSARTLGISKWDAYNQYLALHVVHGGGYNQPYLNKEWLMRDTKKAEGKTKT